MNGGFWFGLGLGLGASLTLAWLWHGRKKPDMEARLLGIPAATDEEGTRVPADASQAPRAAGRRYR